MNFLWLTREESVMRDATTKAHCRIERYWLVTLTLPLSHLQRAFASLFLWPKPVENKTMVPDTSLQASNWRYLWMQVALKIVLIHGLQIMTIASRHMNFVRQFRQLGSLVSNECLFTIAFHAQTTIHNLLHIKSNHFGSSENKLSGTCRDLTTRMGGSRACWSGLPAVSALLPRAGWWLRHDKYIHRKRYVEIGGQALSAVPSLVKGSGKTFLEWDSLMSTY